MIQKLFEIDEEIRNEEMKRFLERASNADGIDTSQIQLGYLVDDDTGLSEYKLLTDCSHKTPHNLLFFDIIKKLVYGIKGGRTGFGGTPNKGLCVTEIENLSKIVNKSRMTLEELATFINNFNEEKITKKYNSYKD